MTNARNDRRGVIAREIVLPGPLAPGDLIMVFGQQLRVVTTEFERSPQFPDAVALVEVRRGRLLHDGDHLRTPAGIVRVRANPDRPTVAVLSGGEP